ncbi:26S proteasome non-ATPase regulatory subunit 5 [Bicyclus anynana]|uniref:26S proteasome non-ATPase regulatory subunit 5 n=1 Tax=Bicyclus anynana TaxID=110368 RepID=A0A6J1MHK8_BICAN|nr:26S proteasome non-ATPase regulatory subunit 5 [Bicyclus anynana]
MTQQNNEQFRIFTEKLKTVEERSTALNDIKNLLAYKPASEAVPTIRNIGISKILHCLNETDKIEQLSLTCEVLKLCFEKFDTGDVIKTYTSHIMYLLRHEKDCVRRLAIDEVCKVVTTDPSLLPIPQYIDLYVAIGQMVADQDLGVANKAVLITSNLPAEAYPKVLEEMKIALEGNSSSRCNAFEVIVNISTKSYDILEMCVAHGYFDFMVTELQTDDILYQMNILELLSQLAIKPHGITFLVKQGALQKLSELIMDLQNNPFRGLLTPGYMKFFGCIAHCYPKEIFQKYPALLELLFNALESDDLTILPVALDTLGFIGTTWEGKLSLVALGSKYTQTIQNIGVIIKNSRVEIKVRALHCMSNLICTQKDPKAKTEEVDQRITLMTREWFRSLSKQPGPMEVLFDICKNPFLDIQLAGLTLLDAVCQHQWGQEMVAQVAGFVEYLLDRSVDNAKQSNEAKYDIVKRLTQSSAFDSNIITRLQTYVEQGPFYSETTLQVAMEEE